MPAVELCIRQRRVLEVFGRLSDLADPVFGLEEGNCVDAGIAVPGESVDAGMGVAGSDEGMRVGGFAVSSGASATAEVVEECISSPVSAPILPGRESRKMPPIKSTRKSRETSSFMWFSFLFLCDRMVEIPPVNNLVISLSHFFKFFYCKFWMNIYIILKKMEMVIKMAIALQQRKEVYL